MCWQHNFFQYLLWTLYICSNHFFHQASIPTLACLFKCLKVAGTQSRRLYNPELSRWKCWSYGTRNAGDRLPESNNLLLVLSKSDFPLIFPKHVFWWNKESYNLNICRRELSKNTFDVEAALFKINLTVSTFIQLWFRAHKFLLYWIINIYQFHNYLHFFVFL